MNRRDVACYVSGAVVDELDIRGAAGRDVASTLSMASA